MNIFSAVYISKYSLVENKYSIINWDKFTQIFH